MLASNANIILVTMPARPQTKQPFVELVMNLARIAGGAEIVSRPWAPHAAKASCAVVVEKCFNAFKRPFPNTTQNSHQGFTTTTGLISRGLTRLLIKWFESSFRNRPELLPFRNTAEISP